MSGFSLLAYLFMVKPPKDIVDNVYESQKFNHQQFSNIHFVDRSDQLGVNYFHDESFSKISFKNMDIWLELVAPSTSVIDINDDGFMDIYVTTMKGAPNLLYINHEGKYFTEEASKYGLADLNYEAAPAYALWGDFNNDGFIDLVLARMGCHRFFLGNKDHHFVEHSEWMNGYCSGAEGVNTADFFNHGKLDLVFANYLRDSREKISKVLWMSNVRFDNTTGGENHLLKNESNEFILETKANFLTRSYTHNAGITDVNLDGYYDIFFANDFSHDQMFLNKGNGEFLDVTNQYIPKAFHGLAGMNTEFYDYNDDGRIDLYVSNIYKPPFYRSFNLLWKKKLDNTYENVSNQVGTAQCGFSWGSKFADLDNDGQSDLMVVNGRNRSRGMTKPAQGSSMWYERVEVSQIPKILRKFYRPKEYHNGRYISAFERKCLFMQRDGKFYDVADQAGFNDREENRGISLIDYDNDGKMDAITSGPRAKLKIYHNESVINVKNNWIGLSLRDKYGSPIPHGAKIHLKLKTHQYVRELFPANGYKGFNDPRIHFGIGESKNVEYVDIFWPLSKITKRYRNLTINSYNKISEKASNEIIK